MARYYFDWAATAPCDPKAAQTLTVALTRYPGNPSSLHSPGKEARAFTEECRQKCAEALQIPPETIVFTSGGSESNNIVISSFLRKRQPITAIATSIEHPSVLNPLFELKNAGHTVGFLKTTDTGVFSLDDLKRRLTPSTALVCLIHTHNEAGTVQPVTEAVRLIRDFEREHGARIHVHCDAVQAAGKTDPDWTTADVDSASLSAHKFGGPRGVGLLYLKKPLQPLYSGGGQERGLRPGTENVPGIAAMTDALRRRSLNRTEETAAARKIRRMLTNAFSAEPHILLPFFESARPDAENDARFSPYVLTIAIPGLPSEVTQRLLDDRGFAVSAGSACSANAAANKQKLKNPFGFDKKTADSLLRLSWGHTTTADDAQALIDAVRNIIRENQILLR